MAPSLSERIAQSGLFDKKFYLASYRKEIPAGMPPLEHFVRHGIAAGLKPNPCFDPLAYRLLHRDVGPGDPVAHLLDHYHNPRSEFPLQQALRRVEITPTYLPTKSFDIELGDSNRNSLEHAAEAAAPRVTEFSAGGRIYRLLVPAPGELLDRFREDRPFAFARISHGDWDGLYVFRRYRGRVARAVSGLGFSSDHIDRLTVRLCAEFYPDDGWDEGFYLELLADLADRKPIDDLLISVSFKGFPTADEQLFYRTLKLKPVDVARLNIFAEYFDPAEPLYDANLFKRWAVAGTMSVLPDVARERPVILMGAQRLASLGRRWTLPRFLHIPIPPINSQRLRYDLLDQSREKIAEAKYLAKRYGSKRPLFLLQGSSFAYWLMRRLIPDYPDIFFLDLGQSLHIWFYDREDIPFMPERRLYGRTIVSTCGLADYYSGLGVLLTPEMNPAEDDAPN